MRIVFNVSASPALQATWRQNRMTNRPGMMVGDDEHTVQHAMLEVGQPAPPFTVLTPRFAPRTLDDYAGKIKVLSVIPSVDTSVCSAQTRRFNEAAASLGDGIVVLTISADAPFALGRYCANEGIENSETLSTARDMQFADDYGVHDVDWRMCQRAVFVLDRDNIVQHAEYVPDMGQEVDFEAALAAAKALT